MQSVMLGAHSHLKHSFNWTTVFEVKACSILADVASDVLLFYVTAIGKQIKNSKIFYMLNTRQRYLLVYTAAILQKSLKS